MTGLRNHRTDRDYSQANLRMARPQGYFGVRTMEFLVPNYPVWVQSQIIRDTRRIQKGRIDSSRLKQVRIGDCLAVT